MTNAKKAKGQRSAGRGGSSKAARREAQRRRDRQRVLWIVCGVIAVVVVALVVILSGGGDGDTPAPFGPSAPEDVSIERSDSGAPLAVGDAIPSFSAPKMGGGNVDWASYAGQPTVLVVWASWCPHCQRELPVLVPAVEETDASLVSVTTAIGQSPSPNEPDPTPPGFLDEHDLDLTTAVDDAENTLMNGLGVTSFPTVFYVGEDGRIAAVTIGEVSDEEVQAHLAEIGVR